MKKDDINREGKEIMDIIANAHHQYVYRGDGLLECVLNHVNANNARV